MHVTHILIFSPRGDFRIIRTQLPSHQHIHTSHDFQIHIFSLCMIVTENSEATLYSALPWRSSKNKGGLKPGTPDLESHALILDHCLHQSPILTLVDFRLWENIKSGVYRKSPSSFLQLKKTISPKIIWMVHMCFFRLKTCFCGNGGPIEKVCWNCEYAWKNLLPCK